MLGLSWLSGSSCAQTTVVAMGKGGSTDKNGLPLGMEDLMSQQRVCSIPAD